MLLLRLAVTTASSRSSLAITAVSVSFDSSCCATYDCELLSQLALLGKAVDPRFGTTAVDDFAVGRSGLAVLRMLIESWTSVKWSSISVPLVGSNWPFENVYR